MTWWKFWQRKKKTDVRVADGQEQDEQEQDETKDVYIQTGTYSLDGGRTVRSGWPLTKTNIARKPSKRKGEIGCPQCDGKGWDANSGGGVFICPTCSGTGVIDGNGVCTCGHKRYEHYADDACEAGYLDLYAEAGHRMLNKGEKYNVNNRPCKCDRFTDRAEVEVKSKV